MRSNARLQVSGILLLIYKYNTLYLAVSLIIQFCLMKHKQRLY